MTTTSKIVSQTVKQKMPNAGKLEHSILNVKLTSLTIDPIIYNTKRGEHIKTLQYKDRCGQLRMSTLSLVKQSASHDALAMLNSSHDI